MHEYVANFSGCYTCFDDAEKQAREALIGYEVRRKFSDVGFCERYEVYAPCGTLVWILQLNYQRGSHGLHVLFGLYDN